MKVDRLVSIILTLLDKQRMSAQELADTFEVSLRTIYRDLDAINQAGIPVRATPGVGGGFEIMPNYKIDRKVFSATDLSAILMGLSSLSTLMRGDELLNALAKVKSFIPADKAHDIELKANQIHLDLTPWWGNKNLQPYLETIKTALQENRLVSFDYVNQHGNQSTRTAEPYQLVLKSNHWYWQGYCCQRNDYRLFKLSRMANLNLHDEKFVPRKFPNPQTNFKETWESIPTKIKLRIHVSVLESVLDFCSQEDITPDGAQHYLVDFPFIENDYNYQLLFSFGDQCECLEPLPIRAEMKRRARNIVALYER